MMIYGYNSDDDMVMWCTGGKKFSMPYSDFERMTETIRRLKNKRKDKDTY